MLDNYRGTSLIRKKNLLAFYSRTMPRVLWWSQGGRQFRMSEVPPHFVPCSERACAPHTRIQQGAGMSRTPVQVQEVTPRYRITSLIRKHPSP